MEIKAGVVQKLREQTGAGMMKCKEALATCNGDFEQAVDYLRKKGLASAENKASRATSQGLVHAVVSADRQQAAIVEVNCETDFVARNDHYRGFVNGLADLVLNNKTVKTPADTASFQMGGQSLDEARKALIAKTGENVTISRCESIALQGHGVCDAYIHGEGTLAVVVVAECANENGAKHDDLKTFAHEVALQIAAMKPAFIVRTDVSQDVIDRERDVVLGQIKNDPKNANKPENIMVKIVDGRLDKYFKERCLMEQLFIRDDTKTILDLANELGKKLGGEVKVTSFRRWGVGEAPQA
jgi:elongation factor Ts